ncbi:MAG: 4-hydroxy-3-methylbut-2-enyl diphosphate reductase [Spirochaetes bacterium]|nr:4-hydroxy-3-methylbut-2-enyl diphosphate reductase [Spirochaetota bacterium]
MRIELSSHSGFCMGVRNAVLKVIKELNSLKEPIYVHGPIIHNPQTTAILEKRGLLFLGENESVHGKIIAIRTHGISKEKLSYIKNNATRIINLTCPRVAKVQAIVKKNSKENAFTIIIGDEEHAEVIGLKSYAQSGVMVISNKAQIDDIPPASQYLVVSQTTYDRVLFEEIVHALKEKFKDRVFIFDTICNSTKDRQQDVMMAIARGINVLVVVGGKNSANTRRLAALGTEHGIRTYHIENADELRTEDFNKSDYVFITAGASTPAWIINNVLEKLYNIQYRHYGFAVNFLKRLFEFFVRTNIISSVSAFFITAFTSAFIGMRNGIMMPLASSLYLFSMYTLNNCLTALQLVESNPYKYSIYSKNKKLFLALAMLCAIAANIFILSCGIFAFSIYLFSTALGIIYSMNFFKKMIEKTGISLVQKAYNSKTLVTSFGWTIVCAIIPIIALNIYNFSSIAVLFFVFGFTFSRNIILDIIGLQGDLIFGRETLPIVLGITSTVRTAIFVNILCLTIFLSISFALGKFPMLLFATTYPYYLLLLLHISKKEYLVSLKYEVLTEANCLYFILLYWISSSL